MRASVRACVRVCECVTAVLSPLVSSHTTAIFFHWMSVSKSRFGFLIYFRICLHDILLHSRSFCFFLEQSQFLSNSFDHRLFLNHTVLAIKYQQLRCSIKNDTYKTHQQTKGKLLHSHRLSTDRKCQCTESTVKPLLIELPESQSAFGC